SLQLTCFSLKERFPLVLTFWLCLIIMKFLWFIRLRFLTKSFLSLKGEDFTIAVASRVSLSAFGFLCSFSIFLSVSSSPLRV
uniref:Uncharacterized protein n=1 Tax=Oryzias melastigma TaxID=30732 RepID=A0A3B3BJ54_ORYME